MSAQVEKNEEIIVNTFVKEKTEEENGSYFPT
jgi:hypothetical protein